MRTRDQLEIAGYQKLARIHHAPFGVQSLLEHAGRLIAQNAKGAARARLCAEIEIQRFLRGSSSPKIS